MTLEKMMNERDTQLAELTTEMYGQMIQLLRRNYPGDIETVIECLEEQQANQLQHIRTLRGQLR